MSSSTIANNLRSSSSPMTDDELFFSLSRELKPSTPDRVAKAPNASTFLGRASSAGLEVLDTLGSSLVELLSNSKFVSNSSLRGFKVSIFAFEVANTIVKGSNLMQSLTDEYIQIFKKHILLLEGVQLLVSTEIKELLRIAAADKREEFEIFSREVVRFGDMCKDLQWHNLDRVFRFDLDRATNKRLREEAEISMLELANLAQYTAELYHEYHALDRFEQVYQRKLEEVKSLRLPQKGESLMILQTELKLQRKLVRSLMKKSLWSKSLEEIVEKLVDVVTFINQEIAEDFDENAAMLTNNDKETDKTTERLGVSGLALHYANLITQINNIASRPASLHPKMRDTLYNSLPASVKAGLRSCLQAFHSKEVMTLPQIKVEMEKTLKWLVPMATDTTKAHQTFGWVGEWANTGFEFGKKTSGGNNIIRLQTLYHADKHKMDQYILDLVILLHRLVNLATGQLPAPKRLTWLPSGQPQRIKFSLEEKNLLEKMTDWMSREGKNILEEVTDWRTVVPGVSKSQKFVMTRKKKQGVVFASSRSMGSSPRRDLKYANANVFDE
ncbi:hypothetical protein L1987_65223 [Smallanthus sonchifolius]|uniref:Uncharacterized protein n=1 Tax=Smallanthus sonchifolius TaxID=185202 RepID=A0ACB9BTV3_9ASTR|nr:hypothetical protein L1987_65223 [Smallanthus sonchifolius]